MEQNRWNLVKLDSLEIGAWVVVKEAYFEKADNNGNLCCVKPDIGANHTLGSLIQINPDENVWVDIDHQSVAQPFKD